MDLIDVIKMYSFLGTLIGQNSELESSSHLQITSNILLRFQLMKAAELGNEEVTTALQKPLSVIEIPSTTN